MADPAGSLGGRRGEQVYRDVMQAEPPAPSAPFEASVLDFVFADVWTRPGLSRRDRRWVSLTCAGAADTVGPIESHVYAALASDDISPAEMGEFVLHFAVYCGWPKASFLNQVAMVQWARICQERGQAPPVPAEVPVWSAGLDPEARMQGGREWFSYINCVGSPPPVTPYFGAGILNYVFGEVWQRTGLSDKDRRIVTLAAVGLDDTEIPIRSHVYAALKSGDVSLEEMNELVLHFAVHSGWPKASFLNQVTLESWRRIESEGGVRAPVAAPQRGFG